MNQRRSKKIAKQCESRIFKAQKRHQTTNPLPLYGKIVIGKSRATIPYVDKMGEIVSWESQNAPIVLRYKPKRTAKFISKILKKTGIEPLAEIGDVITGKL